MRIATRDFSSQIETSLSDFSAKQARRLMTIDRNFYLQIWKWSFFKKKKQEILGRKASERSRFGRKLEVQLKSIIYCKNVNNLLLYFAIPINLFFAH